MRDQARETRETTEEPVDLERIQYSSRYVQERYGEALKEGKTSPEELKSALEHIRESMQKARNEEAESKGEAGILRPQGYDVRLAVSTRLGGVLVTSALTYHLAGVHPCTQSRLEEDQYQTGEAGRETTHHVPPPDLDRAQGETYSALRRDGTGIKRSAQLARIL